MRSEQAQPLELVLPELLNWVAKLDFKLSKPFSSTCQINALNDIEATFCWLKKHAHNLNTFLFIEGVWL